MLNIYYLSMLNSMLMLLTLLTRCLKSFLESLSSLAGWLAMAVQQLYQLTAMSDKESRKISSSWVLNVVAILMWMKFEWKTQSHCRYSVSVNLVRNFSVESPMRLVSYTHLTFHVNVKMNSCDTRLI